MTKFLNLNDAVAETLYRSFRCGIAHEGTTKLKTFFFVNYQGRSGKDFIARNGDLILLDVTELARRYVAAIELIDKDVMTHLSYVPAPSINDVTAHSNSLLHINEITDDKLVAEFLGLDPGAGHGRSGFSGHGFTGSGGAVDMNMLRRSFPNLTSIITP